MSIAFSIVTPIKNGSHHIEAYATTLCSQTYCDWRAVVVDDGSCDDSWDKLSALAEADPRFSVIQRGGPACDGPSMARNLALSLVDGDYVCFLDIDDEWHPDRLAIYAEILRADDDVQLLYSSYVRAFMGSYCGKIRNPSLFRPPRLWSHVMNPIPMLTACVRRNVIADLRFEVARHEDYLFWHEVLRRLSDRQIRMCSRPLAVYRIHRQSLSANKIRATYWIYSCYRRLGRTHAASVVLLLIRGCIQVLLYFREYLLKSIDLRGSFL